MITITKKYFDESQNLAKMGQWMATFFWVKTIMNADKIVNLVSQFGEPLMMLLEKSVEWPHITKSWL